MTVTLTSDTILDYARGVGRTGVGWGPFTCNDEALAEFCENSDTFDTKAIEAAFLEGRTAWKCSGGWVTVWTTAPDDFDSFQTETVEVSEWKGKSLRRVLVDPGYVAWHQARYSTGLHGSWTEDPRVAERELADRYERFRLDDERRATARAEGLAWLGGLTDADLKEAIESDDLELRGIEYRDARAERDRRAAELAERARAAAWERCRAAFMDGATLIDDGEPAQRGQFGLIPGRPSHIYYGVHVTNDWEKLVERAVVVDVAGASAGSLEGVAEWITAGRYRVAAPDDVPPEPVVRRIGHERYREIKRLVIDGLEVWVGRPAFAADPMPLNGKGHIVRGKRGEQAILLARKAT